LLAGRKLRILLSRAVNRARAHVPTPRELGFGDTTVVLPIVEEWTFVVRDYALDTIETLNNVSKSSFDGG
jgi:hypothetical protein